jgi:hypothetical protein
MSNLHAVGSSTDVPLVTTAETVVATTSIFNVGNTGGQGVSVGGVFNITTGTGTTAIVVRVRRATLTGTQVGESQTHTIGAAVSANIAFEQLDSGVLDGTAQSYVVTVSQTAASANGTVNNAAIHAQSATAVE